MAGNDRSASAPAHGPIRTWVMASRPATLTAAAVPVLVGTACALAVGGFKTLPALAALVSATFIQIGTNLANDVFDYEKGADRADRLGPTRVTQAGLLSPRQVRAGMWIAFALATLVGCYLIWLGGWIILAIGLASIAVGIAYTAGPFPLGYNGLGDLFVFIFFGFVAVCGTTYVQVGHVPTLAWLASVPVGALATAILVVNNLRDRKTDSLAGKRTIAVRHGGAVARGEYVLLLLVAYAVPILLASAGLTSRWVLLPLVTLPIAAAHTRILLVSDGPILNQTLRGTARLLLAHGLLFAMGIGMRALLDT